MKRLRLFILLLILIAISNSAIANDIALISKNISYKEGGTYYTTWYDNKMYFVGYSKGPIAERDIFTFNATSNSGQLHSVLKDENIIHKLGSRDKMSLQDGYFLQINDVDSSSGNVFVTLLKNGSEIESNIIVEGENYIFLKDIGNVSLLPIIAIHLDKVMNGQLIFINGIFQISEDYVLITPSQTPTPTPIVTPVCLKIDITKELMQLRMVPIRITYSGTPVIAARVDYDGNMIGETDNNGSIELVLDTSGIHTITASKEGYYNGSKVIVVVTPIPSPKINRTPASTAIQSTSKAPQPVGTINDRQEIASNTSPLNDENYNNDIIDQNNKVLNGSIPASIVALILIIIIIISRLRKRD